MRKGILGFFVLAALLMVWRYADNKTNPAKPSWYHPRFCAAERETIDEYGANIPKGHFVYDKIMGCSAEIVLPEEWKKWRIQTANPERPDDRMEISCSDGRVIFPLALPSTPLRMDACGGDYKNQHSLRVQSNADLRFIRTAGGPPPADSSR